MAGTSGQHHRHRWSRWIGLYTKDLNKKIGLIKADLKRHFDLVQAKDQIAYPQIVIAAYKTPINGHDLQQQKIENLELSVLLDGIIEDYVNLCKKMKKLKECVEVSSERLELFGNQKQAIKDRLEKLEKASLKLFDNQNRIKTLMLAVDEYLLHFTQLALLGKRSENTLEKWISPSHRCPEHD